ncbi:MAG: M1 family metallopeptidase [Elusimicrobiota bacterium]|nr:M1 family metallopeptidase [Elusimicrobiota bacterium]
MKAPLALLALALAAPADARVVARATPAVRPLTVLSVVPLRAPSLQTMNNAPLSASNLAPAVAPFSPAPSPAAFPAPARAPVAAADAPRAALESLGTALEAAHDSPRGALDAGFDALLPRELSDLAPACAGCAPSGSISDVPGAGLRPASPAIPAAPSGRLPKSVKPKRYDLRLRLEPEAGTFTGRVKTSLSVSEPTTRLVMNSLDLAYGRVSVNGVALDASKVLVDDKAETVTLLLDAPLKKGAAVVELEYSGKMNELMRGLFKARGKSSGKEEAWAFTHLEPTHARRVLPSWDEPAFKASFRLTIDAPAGLRPLSNMPAVSDAVIDGRRVVSFAETPKMSSYLLAVFAARLSPKSRKVGKTVVTVWAPPEQLAQAGFALDAAVKALGFLNKWFAYPYMLPKLDLVVSPDFASGAMENWGAILFRDASFLIDPKLSSDAAKRRVAEVVSHEVVHQWFGNLVTMGWWNDLWLNEAFATWVAYKVVHDWKPSWKVWEDFGQGKRSPLSIDALPGTRAVRSQASTPAEIQAMFDPMSYEKGGALLRMIEDFVGEKAFLKGVRSYMKRYAYKNAESADFWREIERASGQPIRAMAEAWLERPGVPVVEMGMTNPWSRTLNFEQKRFSAFGLKDETRWPIPMTVRYRLKGEKKARTHRVFLDPAETGAFVSLPGKGDLLWAYPNAGELGYFRLSFGREALRRLLAHKDELTAVERSGLLNHLWAQVRAGVFPVEEFLAALAAFKGDPSRLLLEDAAGYLKTLSFELATSGVEKRRLAAFAAEFFAPAFERLGWDKKPGESPDAALTRPTVLNLLALLAPESLKAGVAPRLAAYLEDPARVDASIQAVVLTAAARAGDAALFEAYRERLAAPRTPEQKELMLRALAEFTAPELLERYLAMTLSSEIRAQDAWKPFVWLLSNPSSRARAWAFVKANWPALVAKVGPRGATRVVAAAGGLVTPEWRVEVEAFFRAPANDVEMARKTLDQTLETIDLGLRLRSTQTTSLQAWSD